MTLDKPKLVIAICLMNLFFVSPAASNQTTDSQRALNGTDLVENARKGRLQTVESILNNGIDANAKSKDGETALAAAAGAYTVDGKGYVDVVERLLNRGARVDDRSLGQSAMSVDIGFGFHERPMPSYSFLCGNSIGPMFEQYKNEDKIGVTALLAAAGAGRSQIVASLIARGADFEAKTFEGATPLMLATISNDLDSMKMLLRKGADVNSTAKKGQTALMLASWSDGRGLGAKRSEAIKLLLDSGAYVNARDAEGTSALMGAAEADNQTAAKLLLSRGAEVNAKSQNGRTALMKAAYAHNVEMVQLLLSEDADSNARDDDQSSALIDAAFHGDADGVSVLLKGGARSDSTSENGVGTALLAAELRERGEASRVLRQAGAALSNDEELILAANRGYRKRVGELLEKGADPNARAFGGKSVLLYAAGSKAHDPGVVSLLIEYGADFNARSNSGESALMIAAFEGSTQAAKLLVEAGADVNARSKGQMNALINAAWRGHLDIVRFLIEKGADVNVRGRSGNTALYLSQYGGINRESIALLLKEAGAKD